jgi:hypothetical protein
MAKFRHFIKNILGIEHSVKNSLIFLKKKITAKRKLKNLPKKSSQLPTI